MKSTAFWILDAIVLFSLSLVYLHQGYQRKNSIFALWLFNGVTMQLVAAWALAAGPPGWLRNVRAADDVLEYLLTTAILVVAVMRRDCPVNRSLLWGLGAMVVLRSLSVYLGESVEHSAQIWLRNVAFFGPAIFLLISLSGIRFDMLPLWLSSVFRALGSRRLEAPAMASAGIIGLLRNRRE